MQTRLPVFHDPEDYPSISRFQALIENSSDGITLLGADGNLLYVSPSTQKLLGYSYEETIGQNPAKWTHPDDLASVIAILSEAFQKPGAVFNAQYRMQHKDGSWRWIESVIQNLLGDPNIRAIVFNYRDISARRQAEDEIKRRAAHQSALNAIITATAQSGASLTTLIEVALEQTLHAFVLEMGAIWTETGVDLSRGLPEACAPTIRSIALSHHFEIPQLSAIPDWRDAPAEGQPGELAQVMASFGVRANLVASLWSDRKRTGVLSVMSSQPRIWTEDEINLFEAICCQLGGAIERARLFEETQTRLAHLTALRAIDDAINSNFDLVITLNVLLDQVQKQLRVDAAAVLLLDSTRGTLDYAAGRGFKTQAIKRTHLGLGEGLAGKAALERKPASVIRNLQDHPAQVRSAMLAQEQFQAYSVMPLIAKGQIKGVLEVFQRAPFDPNPEWLEFFAALAGQAAIAIENAQLFEGLQRSNLELTLAYDSTIAGWSHALDLRDRETEGHTQRVIEMTVRLARRMGFSEEELVHIHRGALLHDIGKMGIPDRILLKPGPLSEAEWDIMRQHPTYAYEMLSRITYLRPALGIPYCHHEKWDGTGYPRGLQGQAIPLAARLFAVVDVWDALRSDRPYRSAWSKAAVRSYIREEAGKHFDPKVVEIFLADEEVR